MERVIEMNPDYDEIALIESHLMHEVKRRGREEFVKTYSESIEDFKTNWSRTEFCYLLAMLEYLDESFKYDEQVKLDKYVLDICDFDYYTDKNEEFNVEDAVRKSLPSFLKRGFIFSEVGEAL